MTDNIVDGDQALSLKNQVITNTAVGTNPLIVNGITSTTADLQQWQVNGVNQARISNNGYLWGIGLVNISSSANGVIDVASNGVLITRNINDTNPALRINKNQGTGNILELRSANANKLEVDVNGWLYQNGVKFLHGIGGNANSNIALGYQALNINSTGSNNIAVGYRTLVSNNNNYSTGVGFSSLENATGSSNTALGNSSGRNITTGSQNTFLGMSSGENGAWGTQLATASNSTAIGNQSYTDKSNQMVFGNASVTEFKFDRNASAVLLAPNASFSGNVGIGTNAPASLLHLNGTGYFPTKMITLSGAEPTRYNANIGTNIVNGDSIALSFGTRSNNVNYDNTLNIRNGNVGIGTTSPASLLHTLGTTNNFTTIETSSTGNHFVGVALKTATKAYELAVGANGSASSFANNFYIWDATSSVARLTIASGGNVGIGTSSPGSILSISRTATDFSNAVVVNNLSGASGSVSDIRFTNASSATGLRIGKHASGFDNSNEAFIINETNGGIDFGTNNTGRLKIFSTGLIGINESSPSAQLQVKSGATNRVPLIVDTLASQSANLQEWKVNGTSKLAILFNGAIAGSALFNLGDANNAFIDVLTTGTTIGRNIADTNPALIVNLANASATGNIQVWQKAGTAQLAVNGIGKLINTTNSANASVHLSNQGVVIERDIADANVPLTVNQNNATATGNIQNWAFDSGVVAYVEADGDIYNDNGTYGTASDIRIKENIVEARNYTEDLMKLRVVKYSLKKEKQDKPTHLGFIAQEFEEVFPNMVSTSERDDIADFKSIKMSVLIPMLVKTIQEQEKRIKELEAKIK